MGALAIFLAILTFVTVTNLLIEAYCVWKVLNKNK